MAGYFLYSLDWNRFDQFVKQPSEEQLLAFADLFSQSVENYYDEFEKDDPVKDWPVEPEELAPQLKSLLRQEDWYGGLSDTGKLILEQTLQSFCMEDEEQMGFRVESDGVYWDVIDLIRSHHGVEPDVVTDKAISQFGTRPFHYLPEPGKRPDFFSWHPNHSMQTPDEVRQLLEEIQAAESTVMNSHDDNAKEEYEEQLLPAVSQVAQDGRLLFISVDT